MNRKKNSIYLKLLMFPYYLYATSYIAIVLFSIFYQWNVSPLDALEIKFYISVLVFFICVFLFIKDRSFLMEAGFYCPSWIWFIFLPMYNDDILKGIISLIVLYR